MAVKLYVGDSGGIARQIKKLYVGDANGIAREVKTLYAGDAGGTARKVFEKTGSAPTGSLPTGYTKVEYVQNGTSGTTASMPYIQMPNRLTASKFAIKFSSEQEISASSQTVYAVYGYTVNDVTTSNIYRYGISLVGGKVRCRHGIDTSWTDLIDYAANTVYEIELDSDAKTMTANGVVKSKDPHAHWRNEMNRLFGQQNNLNDERQAKATKVYSLKMWGTSGNLLLDFVPCIDPSGAIGMYDVVGGNFYGNSNTSTNSSNKFIAGPTV